MTQKLYGLFVPGPDELWPCESKEAADKLCVEHNQCVKSTMENTGMFDRLGISDYAEIAAYVIEWPYSAEEHAQLLKEEVNTWYAPEESHDQAA